MIPNVDNVMTGLQASSVISDLPINSSDEDLFSFGEWVEKFVNHIFVSEQPESIIVGLSGLWGSGKTSFLNLTEKKLSGFRINGNTVTTIRYVPWRVKNRESLISDFLPMLVETIKREASKDPSLRGQTSKLLKNVKKYAKTLKYVETGLRPIGKALSAVGLSDLERIVKILGSFRNAVNVGSIPNIEKLHQRAYRTLEELQIPVVVMIDDVDRLEPEEIVDVLRLVRATAQLPYITFILSYDQVHVIQAIDKVLNVDGQKFLEKFIQLPITVPQISQRQLDTLLEKNISQIIKTVIDYSDLLNNDSIKLRNIIEDIQSAGAIDTPRDVYRILNTCKYSLKSSNEIQNVETLIYLSVIQTKFPLVYNLLSRHIKQTVEKLEYSNVDDSYNLDIEDIVSLLGKDERRNDVVIKIIEKIMSNLRLESRQ